MQAAADSETSSATDLAEWLVQRGTPFRDAHAIVGLLVRRHLSGEGSLRDLVTADSALGPEAVARHFWLSGPLSNQSRPQGLERITCVAGAFFEHLILSVESILRTERLRRNEPAHE